MKFNIWLIKFYFIRGHSQYLALLLSLINFLLISYEFIIVDLNYFNSVLEYLLFSGFIYIPFAILLGRYDFKHRSGPFQVEQNFFLKTSPIYRELNKKLDKIIEKMDVKK